ncbi:hypothetical protein RBU61_00005 [Tissierella sp. MB52-C2]|nr:hypothetical protein [Tissierella sp. MB52-C2]WMM25076.1 hypothetical protein RBU61_00005 [Tissierella sp. MB52-C2]
MLKRPWIFLHYLLSDGVSTETFLGGILDAADQRNRSKNFIRWIIS